MYQNQTVCERPKENNWFGRNVESFERLLARTITMVPDENRTSTRLGVVWYSTALFNLFDSANRHSGRTEFREITGRLGFRSKKSGKPMFLSWARYPETGIMRRSAFQKSTFIRICTLDTCPFEIVIGTILIVHYTRNTVNVFYFYFVFCVSGCFSGIQCI